MNAEVIEFWGKNQLGFPHVVCSDCKGDSFQVETETGADGIERFKWLHCVGCGNLIPVDMTPCFGPEAIKG